MGDGKSCTEIVLTLLQTFRQAPPVISLELSEERSPDSSLAWAHGQVQIQNATPSSLEVVCMWPTDHASRKYDSIEKWAEDMVGRPLSRAELKKLCFFGTKNLAWYDCDCRHVLWTDGLSHLDDISRDTWRTPSTSYKRRRDCRLGGRSERKPLLLSVSGDLLASLWPADYVVVGMTSCKLLYNVLTKAPVVKLK
jgi:hypothetical protein